MFYYHIRTLYIFGEKLGFVSQNGLDRFIFVPSCNQGKLLLSTTNDNLNVKLDKNKIRPHIVPTVTDIVRKIPTLGELTNVYDDYDMNLLLYTIDDQGI